MQLSRRSRSLPQEPRPWYGQLLRWELSETCYAACVYVVPIIHDAAFTWTEIQRRRVVEGGAAVDTLEAADRIWEEEGPAIPHRGPYRTLKII